MENLITDQEALDRGYRVVLLHASKGHVDYPSSCIGTFLLRYWRPRLVEMNTHRAFSRNARSTRAVPTSRFIQEIVNSPSLPLHIGKNKSGMSSDTPVENKDEIIQRLLFTRHYALGTVRALEGVHKQVINNLLDYWAWTDQIITTTLPGLENFIRQRREKAAPELKVIAEAFDIGRELMLAAPVRDWHIPFILPEEADLSFPEKVCVSVGRCASLSYHPPGTKEVNYKADIDRIFSKLLSEDPFHESPFEHQAVWTKYGNARFANFNGWCSIRTLMTPNSYGARAVFNKEPLSITIDDRPIQDINSDEWVPWAIGGSLGYWRKFG